ncbi:unnamed protein product [Cylicocyclus nassatus]|uniref:Uncharacterized protein n=1 Tax=Cylicocyclus nassatus TaxID=53992 RepID=A0AA36DU23_CYLNA|nr:unnamed protein product [Cylicocyclus nassatus]
MMFYCLLMLLPVYCGACDKKPPLWKKHFEKEIRIYCQHKTGLAPKMKFKGSLIHTLQRFVSYGPGKVDSSVTRIFKIPNKDDCRNMNKIVISMIKHIVTKNNKIPKRTCKEPLPRAMCCIASYSPYVIA